LLSAGGGDRQRWDAVILGLDDLEFVCYVDGLKNRGVGLSHGIPSLGEAGATRKFGGMDFETREASNKFAAFRAFEVSVFVSMGHWFVRYSTASRT
jgi:hypothetical protein